MKKTAKMKPLPNVKKGQLWKDRDTRVKVPRYILVESKDKTHATVRTCNEKGELVPGSRTTRISLARFRPVSTGYELIRDVG